MDGEGPKMGNSAELTIILNNSSRQHREISLHSQVAVMYYTGVHKVTVTKDQTDVELLPSESELSFFVRVGFPGEHVLAFRVDCSLLRLISLYSPHYPKMLNVVNIALLFWDS